MEALHIGGRSTGDHGLARGHCEGGVEGGAAAGERLPGHRLASRLTGAYTEHMFRHLESSRRLGSRRHGGPVLLKDLLPSLLDELHEVYVAGGRRTPLDLVHTRTPGAEDMVPASLSRAA